MNPRTVAYRCLILVAGLLAAASLASAADRIVILTYNIHHGEGMDGKIDLPRIARVIEQSGADLVALQEIDRKTRRSKGIDQAEELARLTKLHLAFARTIDFQDGEYGNGILSRHPLSDIQVHPLPSPNPSEKRAALAVRVQFRDAAPPLTFIATHLDAGNAPNRLAQAKKLNDLFAPPDATTPAVLAGDFNATPNSDPIRLLLQRWADTAPNSPPTSPSAKPRQRIDYIWIRPANRWRIVETTVLNESIASDHRPVRTILELNP